MLALNYRFVLFILAHSFLGGTVLFWFVVFGLSWGRVPFLLLMPLHTVSHLLPHGGSGEYLLVYLLLLFI